MASVVFEKNFEYLMQFVFHIETLPKKLFNHTVREKLLKQIHFFSFETASVIKIEFLFQEETILR